MVFKKKDCMIMTRYNIDEMRAIQKAADIKGEKPATFCRESTIEKAKKTIENKVKNAS